MFKLLLSTALIVASVSIAPAQTFQFPQTPEPPRAAPQQKQASLPITCMPLPAFKQIIEKLGHYPVAIGKLEENMEFFIFKTDRGNFAVVFAIPGKDENSTGVCVIFEGEGLATAIGKGDPEKPTVPQKEALR